MIKRHPRDGALMAAALRDPELTSMVEHHHERLDGTGYPDRLSGEEIPLGARIIAVADTFDAITSGRSYRPVSPHKEAIDILKDDAGARLDPAAVRAFCGYYAGRRPLALWAFVAGLPERVVSWFGGSVASVASTAKVVAVAVLVGGVAGTSATIGLPPAQNHPAKTPSHSRVGPWAQVSPAAAANASVAPSAAVTGSSRHSRLVRQVAVTWTVYDRAPAGGATAAQSPTLDGAPAPVSQGTGAGGHQGVAPGKSESPTGKTEDTPDKGKTESPSKGKSEQAPSESEQAPGKHEEAPVKNEEGAGGGKGEPTPVKEGEPTPVKSEGEPTPVKSKETQTKGEETQGKVKEAVKEIVKEVVKEVHGKVEEVVEKTTGVLSKLK